MADEEIQQEPRPRGPPPDPRPERPRRPLPDYDDDYVRRPDEVQTFIPYKNPLGLIAYYLGVFSFIPCAGLLLGPAALILGVLGVRYRNRNPMAGGLGHAISGIVMGGLTSLANWRAVLVGVVNVAWR